MQADGATLPPLTNGQAGQVSPELVSTGVAQPHNLLWDVGLAVVVAIAAPLLLKYALESPKVRALLRFSSSKRPPETMEHFDFDAE